MSVRKALAIVALVPCLALGAEWNITPGHWSWKAGVDNVDALPVSGNLVNDVRVAGCVDAVGECSPTLWIWTSDEEWSQIVGEGGGSAYWLDPDAACAADSVSLDTATRRLRIGTGACTESDLLVPGLGLTASGSALVSVREFEGEDQTRILGDRLAVLSTNTEISGTARVIDGTLAPGSGGSITATTAGTLATNGGNCAAGQAAAGVDASGAAEGCAAYLTDLSGQTIGDLSDVSETGAAAGEALVSDGAGSWSPSAAPVCLSDGTNCPSAGSVSIADVTSGTTTEDYVIGAGGSLKIASTGTIDASGIDVDGDGVRNVSVSSSRVNFDSDDDGVVESYIDANGDLSWGDAAVTRAGAGGVDIENGSGSYAYVRMTGSQHFIGATMKALIDPGVFFTSEIRLASDMELAWSSSTVANAGSIDARVARAGAGVVAVDGGSASTGAALRLTPLATAPATCTAYADLYADTSGALCWCSATNTWSVVSGAGSCT